MSLATVLSASPTVFDAAQPHAAAARQYRRQREDGLARYARSAAATGRQSSRPR